jgi:hypothetical protein
MKKNGLKLIIGILFIALTSCGGSSEVPVGKQYTLNVEGTYSISEVGGSAMTVKVETSTPQVLIGTMLVEVTDNFFDGLDIEIVNLDVRPQVTFDPELRFSVATDFPSTGIVFKLDEFGDPYDTSFIDIDLVVSSPSSDVFFEESADTFLLEDGSLFLGTLEASAEDSNRSRLPVIDAVPVINFLFRGDPHQATVDSLLVILTPEILNDTD